MSSLYGARQKEENYFPNISVTFLKYISIEMNFETNTVKFLKYMFLRFLKYI